MGTTTYGRRLRVDVYVTPEELHAIDCEASADERNRSDWVRRAAMREVQRRRKRSAETADE